MVIDEHYFMTCSRNTPLLIQILLEAREDSSYFVGLATQIGYRVGDGVIL